MLQCTETVSIFWAVIFGAGDACVRIDLWSILGAFAVFIAIVAGLQWIARRLWSRAKATKIATPKAENDPRPYQDNPRFRDSAIRSTRR